MSHSTAEPFQVEPGDPRSEAAALLIGRLSAELAGRYDHTSDGSGHFRPEDVLVPGGVFLIGWLSGRPVACGAVRPLGDGVGEVKRMYVEPEVRGRGLSRRLLAELEAAARVLGYVSLRLETGNRQPEAIGLYETAGNGPAAPFGPYVSDPRSLYFEKRLD